MMRWPWASDATRDSEVDAAERRWLVQRAAEFRRRAEELTIRAGKLADELEVLLQQHDRQWGNHGG